MTASAIQPTRMARAQINDSAAVLARAFFDDPLTRWVTPDDAKRAKDLPWFFRKAAVLGDRWVEVYTTGATVEGNAIWLKPGETKVSLRKMARTGMLMAPIALGLSAFLRFMKIMNTFEHLHDRDVPEPHWYLMVLGVDPPRQGQGVGGALLQPILARADADRLPCYLETQKSINVPFYQRHGFEIVVEDDIPGGGPHYWTMKRMPR
jgi:ribosomal protein S18 acetylase RimI-like enzyme